MSAINTNQAFAPNGSTIPVIDSDKTGFNSLTSESFIKLLVTQLQNQDPTAPMSNEQLLTQISQMQSLQSNIELSDSLEALGKGQTATSFTSAAASFIGKEISGIDSEGEPVTGVVDRAVLKDGKAFVGIGSIEVSVENVQTIKAASTTAT